MRGILNVSGVSCHISCALQLMAHGISPLVELGRILEPLLLPGGVLQEWVRILIQLKEEDIESPLDPSKLHELLEKKSTLDPHDVGDVVTAIYQLWQVMSKQSKEWKQVVDYLVGGGTTQQLICGYQQTLLRTKRGKVKAMACPFPLNVVDASLETSLKILLGADPSSGTSLKDYDWDTVPRDTYTEEVVGEPTRKNPDEWFTTKVTQILSLPRYLFLSLERFACNSDGDRIWKNSSIDIQSQIVLQETVYTLKGAVLHVSEESLEEEGHYVTIVSTEKSEEWILIDDETCQPLDMDTAFRWMKGDRDEKGVEYCATVVLLEACNRQGISDWVEIREIVRKSHEEAHADFSKPESLVGRRLKVKWAKGKYYQGVVESYDNASGKHRVVYDDGDTREYILAKKTIEWLS